LEQLKQSIYPCAVSNHNALNFDRQDYRYCRICGLNLYLHPSTLKDMRWNDILPDGFCKEIYFLSEKWSLDTEENETEIIDSFTIHEHCSKGMI